MNKLFHNTFFAVVPIFVIYLYDSSYGMYPENEGLHKNTVLFAGMFLMVGLWAFLSTYWTKVRRLRRFVSKRHSIEGLWLEFLYNGHHPLCLSRISFNGRNFEYYGWCYDASGNRKADYMDKQVHVSESGDLIRFEFIGALYSEQNSPDEQRMRGYGQIRFMDNGSGKYVEGAGYYYEGGRNDRLSTGLRKVPDKIIKHIVGNNISHLNTNDLDKIIEHYLRNPDIQKFIASKNMQVVHWVADAMANSGAA